MTGESKRILRSKSWFDNPDDPSMTALYVERYLNYGLTREELQSGRPIIGIAQSGSDLSPCNRHHIELAQRVRAGIRDAGGVALEFPVHPIQETGRRPTAALDRNLCTLSLIEILHGYPLDGVVLTTGCDKTTPAQLMAAATVDIPAIVLNSGPMLNGWYQGKRVGSGTIVWEARRRYARGEIDYEGFIELVAKATPSTGHCNVMGTATTMNILAEGLGMVLPGTSAIPAPYKERGQAAFETGRRIVDMVWEDLRPSKIMTREAFENTIILCSAIGGSTNAPPHVNAIARHMGLEVTVQDWQDIGQTVPQLVNMQPVGSYLSEDLHHAGGVCAVMGELMKAGLVRENAINVTGNSVGSCYTGHESENHDVIATTAKPIKEAAGLMVLTGNLFDTAVMKVSGIGDDFRGRYLSNPDDLNAFVGTAIVFDGPEDYHHRINDPDLPIDENSILIIRGCGPVGYPGSAEVVNMQPPDRLLKAGISALPTIGDGRQSGTSESPSILNASPEAAAGGGLALLKTGDKVRVDLNSRRVDAQVPEDEWKARREALGVFPIPAHQTPWQEIHRETVTQLSDGAVARPVLAYSQVATAIPRHSH